MNTIDTRVRVKQLNDLSKEAREQCLMIYDTEPLAIGKHKQ